MLMPLEENIDNALEDTKIGRNFLSQTPIAQEPAPGINRWDYMKLKYFWTEKGTAKRTQWIGDYIYELYVWEKKVISRNYKEL